MDIGKTEITRWHKARGFFTIGYHYIIRRNGSIETGRPLEQAGAHASGHNAESVGICLVGGIDEKGNPQCNYTPSQWDTLAKLVNDLKHKYPTATVIGHNQIAQKACPSFSVPKWLTGGMKPL